MGKRKKFDKIKEIKRLSREENRIYGKAGFHINPKDKRDRRPSTRDLLSELDGYEDDEY